MPNQQRQYPPLEDLNSQATDGQQQDAMSPGRKKPVCTKCNELMVGHRRPNRGVPICPKDDSDKVVHDLSRSRTPTPTRSPVPQRAPQAAYPSPQASPIRRSSAELTFKRGKSWHYQNPNWVTDPKPEMSPSRASNASWVSTEIDPEAAAMPPSTRDARWLAHHGRPSAVAEADVGEEDEDDGNASDASSSISLRGASSMLLSNPISRSLSRVLGSSSPLAAILSTPREEIPRVRAAAAKRGLYAGVVHRPTHIKAEPEDEGRLKAESSWRVVLGRDKDLVQCVVDAQQPDAAVQEPYDFSRGLQVERNEKVGTYPLDPRSLRMSYFDMIIAGGVGGFVMFFMLSRM